MAGGQGEVLGRQRGDAVGGVRFIVKGRDSIVRAGLIQGRGEAKGGA